MLSAESIIATARSQTGLETFESDSFREGLDILVRGINAEPRVTPEGAARLEAQMIQMLTNRLRVDDTLRQHPEILERPIEKPLFVMGLPRTGTTLSIDLLNQDPQRRCLLKWEATDSVPAPELDTYASDPRLLKMRAELEMMLEMMGDVPIKHWEEADDPTECIFVMAQDFKCLMWEALVPNPEYAKWILETDTTSAYTHLKRVMQLLQWKVPGMWTLKTPSHALNVATIKKVFPDSRIIVTHRDPFQTLGSLCSLIASSHGGHIGVSDIEFIANNYPRQLAEHANRPMNYREAHGDDGFYDLMYADMLKDPLGQMRKIYAHFGDPWTDAASQAMEDWLARNPQDKHGAHNYDLSDFGLSREAVAPLFEAYRSRYAIPDEA